jgi:TamB, inner membrane protein subunit of TAM complex
MTETVGKEQRRGRIRRRISFGIAVVVTLLLAATFYQATQLMPRRIARYVNENYLAGTPFELTIEGISGSLLRRIVLKNAVLRYHSTTASYNVFRADEISVTYELLPMFGLRLIVDDVLLRNVAIHLRQDENGQLVIPFPQGKAGAPGGRFANVSPLVHVRHFTIDGLEMTFGGGKRELAVRDVSLEGSVRYAKGDARLTIDEGKAFLVDSGKTVSEVRLAARTDGRGVRLDDFALRLDESFILASGEFRQGRFGGVNLVFNPISLPELHELGLAPKMDGRFRGKLSLSGPVDSLEIAGNISGSGFGVELSSVDFEGLFTPRMLDLARIRGRVFGSGIDGAFQVGIESGDFIYDGECDSLDLSRGFIPNRGIPPMSLTGHVRVVHSKSAKRYQWGANLTHAVVDGYESFGAKGDGVWQDGTGLVIRRLTLDRPGYRITGSGQVASPGDVALILFDVQGPDIGYFFEHFKLPPVTGAVAVTGKLQGPLHDFQVNVNGAVQGLRFEAFGVDSGLVQAEVRRVGTPAPTAAVSLSANRGTIAGRRFQSPSVFIEVDTSLVRVQRARFTRGDTVVVVDLDVKARGARSRINVRHASITTPRETWSTPGPSTVVIDNGTATIDSLVLASGRGQFGVVGTYRERERSMELEVWGRGAKLQLLQEALRMPLRLEGSGDVDLRLYGEVEDPRFDLELAVRDGIIDSVAFDHLAARVAFDGAAYRLDQLVVVTGADSMSARGVWNCRVSPARLAHGDSTAAVWGAPVSMDARFARYPLASVFDALHRPAPVAAAYSGTLSLSGTLEAPRIAARGKIGPSPGPGQELPPARLDLEYANGTLHVNDLSTTAEADVRARGTFPVEISMRRGARIHTDRPMEFKLDMAPLDDQPVELGRYLAGVSLLRGLLEGSVVGTGTPAVPRLAGALSFSRGELQVVGLKESFSDVTLKLDFVDDVIRVSSLTARSGKKGSLVGTGWARVSNYRLSDYRVDVTLNEFWLRSIPDVAVRQDGKLSVRQVQWRDGRRIPSITGALDIREATLSMDIMQTPTPGGGSEFTRPTDTPEWIASVDLFAPKNVWIRNPDMTVEMGTEDMILNRDERGLYFRGELDILRGSYRLYGNKFTITNGLMNFSASETMRPEMLIQAYTVHRTSDGDHNIDLTFSWPHDKKEPQIILAYPDEPGYSEADIWKMLGGSFIAAGVATNALESAINEQMLSGVTVDVEQRQIENRSATSATNVEKETLVGIGKYLWEDNIYLQYRRGLSIGGEQEVNMEYRPSWLSSRFLLRSQFIYNSQRNRSGIAGKDTDEYNVDLKYRFEY